MADDGEGLGQLSTETVEERRARLVGDQPLGSPAWRRAVLVLLVVLALVVGVWFGVVPGSSALGRYPIWSLYALADRIEAANARQPSGCNGERASRVQVDLVRGRVVAPSVGMTLTTDERDMVVGLQQEGAIASVFCAASRVAPRVGGPSAARAAPQRAGRRTMP